MLYIKYTIFNNTMENIYYTIEQRLDDNIKRLTTLKDIIKTLDNKYINKLIHVSVEGDLNLNDIFPESDETTENNNKKEINGLWLSCGSNWLKWVMLKSDDYCYNDNFLKAENIYEIETKVTKDIKILYINTLDELINFHSEYSYLIDDTLNCTLNGTLNGKGYDIYWNKVQEKYDGLIIDAFLAYQIWEKLNDINYIEKPIIQCEENDLYTANIDKSNNITDNLVVFCINPMTSNNTYNLKDSILQYAKFYLGWYIKWGTFTGVLWNKRSIKKIKLLKFKIKHK